MDKEKHMVIKIILAMLVILTLCTVDGQRPCLAASLSIAPSGSTWAIGTKGELTESTSGTTWTITNDSGGIENISWTVASSGSWTASSDGTQTEINKFVLRKNNSTGQIITMTSSTLVSNWTNGSWTTFGLWFKTPKSGSEQAAHTLTITLRAAAITCAGYYNTYCWYKQTTVSTACTTTCADHGGAISGVVIPLSVQQAVLTQFWPGLTQWDSCYVYSPFYGVQPGAPYYWINNGYAWFSNTTLYDSYGTTLITDGLNPYSYDQTNRACPCAL